MRTDSTVHDLPISVVIERIVQMNGDIARLWGGPQGCAPIEAAELLSRSRLDWQVELSRTLELWVDAPESDVQNAQLILGWANLGALVEGTLKWFLSVYYNTYKGDVDAIKHRKTGDVVDPDGLMLEPLRQFFDKRIWTSAHSWGDWIHQIQQHRNAIHAYKDRDLGDLSKFLASIRSYLRLLMYLHSRLPDPDFL